MIGNHAAHGVLSQVLRLADTATQQLVPHVAITTAVRVAVHTLNAANDMRKIHNFVAKEGQSLRNKFKKAELPPKMIVELSLKSAPTKEAYLQILAQEASYYKWEKGYVLMPSEHFVNPLYEIENTIQFPEGIKAIAVIAEDPTEPPLLIFRGTDASNLGNLVDDIHKNIAELNCTKYEKELEAELERLATTYGRVHIIGHSYGGAVAQRLTAKHPHLISRCTYHNAPAAGRDVANEFRRNIAQLPANFTQPEVRSYRHAKDVVSLLGGEPLPTTRGRSYTTGMMGDYVPYIDAHSMNTLSTGAQVVADRAPDRELRRTANTLEGYRRQASDIIPPIYRGMRNLFRS